MRVTMIRGAHLGLYQDGQGNMRRRRVKVGDTPEVEPHLARQLIASGKAELLDPFPKPKPPGEGGGIETDDPGVDEAREARLAAAHGGATTPTPTPDGPSLDDLNIEGLRRLAQDLGVDHQGKTRDQLLEAIQAKQAAPKG